MDISSPVEDALAGRRSGSAGGVWRSLALLMLALGVATVVGFLGIWVTQQVVPETPPYVGLVFGVLGLLLSLRFISERYEWIMPWYYLLPAILFLLVFTFFPIVLTVILAFTDYAGVRNGALGVSTNTAIESVNGAELTVANASTLSCNDLRGSRRGCNNIRGVVYASGQIQAQGEAIDGVTLTLSEPLPLDRLPTAAEILLPSVGFAAQFPVESVDGATLILGRAPPEDADISSVSLTLDRVPLERRILSVADNVVTLAQPLSEGTEYVSISRYNDFGWVGLDNFRTIARQATRALFPVLPGISSSPY